MASRKRPVAEFNARCLAVVHEVMATGQEVTITKRGRPVAKLIAIADDAAPLFGRLAGWVTQETDLVTPLGVEW